MSREVVTLAKKTKGEYSYNEAIKTLRTNVQFCGSNLRRILLTSAFPDEGKSDVTFALASSLAQIGKKVILIDADIRKSVMVSRYQVETEINGLSQYLTGQREMEEVIYNTNFEGLSIIFAGPYSPNPSELLEEDLFHELLDALDEKFDYIIIDTPPMANVIDGAIIAGSCDGAILVIEAGATSYRLEQKVVKQLEKSGCRILGAVLKIGRASCRERV